MADLNARIKPKKSSVAGEAPLASDLQIGEVAVNTADGKLFVKHTDDSIKEISGSGGGGGASFLGDLEDVHVPTPSAGQVLTYGTKPGPVSSLLAHFDSEGEGDGSPNSTTTTWRANATVTASSKFGSGALLLNAGQASEGVIFDNQPDYNIGADDFCMEAWIFIDAAILPTAGSLPIIYRRGSDGFANNDSSFAFDLDLDPLELRFIYGHGSTNTVFSSPLSSLSVAAWHHFAVSRDGTTLRFFVDGQLNSAHDVTGVSAYSNSRPITVGTYGSAATFTNTNFDCRIDEVRIVTGEPIYTAAFTPPTTAFLDGEGGVPSWVAADAGGSGALGIDGLTDVDTSTNPPALDNTLVWDGTNWVPGEVAGGGGPTHVGTTGSWLGYFDPTPPLEVPYASGAQAGDLAVVIAVGRSGSNSTFADIQTPSGYTQVMGPQQFTSNSVSASVSTSVFTKMLDGGDITTGSVFLTCLPSNPEDDFFVQVHIIRDAEYAGFQYVDTNVAGEVLGAAGYDYSGSSTTSQSLAIFTAQNIYAYNTTSGVAVTPVDDMVIIDGPYYQQGEKRRVTSFMFEASKSTDFNIRALNESGADATLTEGFHITRINVLYSDPSSVESVNGETGVVSLGIQDMDDYVPAPGAPVYAWNFVASQSSVTGSGGNAFASGNTTLEIDVVDRDGNDLSPQWPVGNANTDIWLSNDQLTWYAFTSLLFFNTDSGNGRQISLSERIDTTALDRSAGQTLFLSMADPSVTVPPSAGQALTWTGNSWQPVDLNAIAVRAALGIGEYIDDAAAGAGGVASGAMYYNTTSSDYRLKS